MDSLFALIGGPKQLPLYAYLATVPIVIVVFIAEFRDAMRLTADGARADRLLYVVDALSSAIGKTFGWSIVVLTFTTSYEVFARYMFGAPTDWAFDTSYILYGTLFMLAGAYALSRNGHVRGDFLYRAWRPRRQAAMDLVLYLLFFFPGNAGLHVLGFQLCRIVAPNERAFLGQSQRPHRLALQVADSDRRLLDGLARHRRGHSLPQMFANRRMAAAPA